MFMPTSDRQTVAGGLLDQKAFSVEMNSMLFHSVISGIYADKIRAPFRELATNARDGHVAAGRLDQPFDIQLPSSLDPTFRIRDYGCSMTHEEVMGLYSTMFASSKRETNDLTGMIGLGSKSPFAYTSIFNVIAWKDGEKRHYSCFIGDDEVPQTALIGRVPSDEPDGIEVSFAVKQEDIHKFRSAAPEVLFGFDPKPNILNESFQWPVANILHQGNGWVLYDKNTVPFRGLMARQGAVLYPIQAQPLGLESEPLFGWPCVLDFPIGELSVSTSRENLGYDQRTRSNLVRRITAAKEDMAKLVQKDIDACKSYLDACVLLASNTSYVAPQRDLWTLIANGASWRNKKLKTTFAIQGFNNGFTMAFLDASFVEMGVLKSSVGHRPSAFGTTLTPVALRDNVLIYHEKASTKSGPSRMRRVIKENTDSKSILWIRTTEDSLPNEAKEMIGWAKVLDLGKVEPLTLGGSKKKKEGLRTLRYIEANTGWSRYDKPSVTFEEVEVTEDLLFVEQDGNQFKLNGRWNGVSVLWNQLYSAIKAGFLPAGTRVYCLNKTNIKVLETVKMTPVESALREGIRKALPGLNLSQDDYVVQQRRREVKNMREAIAGASIPQDIEDYLAAVEADDVNGSKAVNGDTRRMIEEFCPTEYEAQKRKDNPTAEMKSKLEEKYPLLFNIVGHWGADSSHKRKMQHYMELLLK